MATEVTRGSTLVFVASFTDDTGAPVNPASASLYVRYCANDVAVTDTIALSQAGSTWTASWDSSVADGGRADWCIRSAGSNKAALEGKLALKTNLANPAP